MPTPPWRITTVDVCPECGSTRTQVATWFGRRVATPVVYSSFLNRWIVSREGSHTHAWRFLHENNSSGLRACGSAPATYTLRDHDFDEYFARVPDADVAKLLMIVRTGTDREQEAAVNEFADVLFRPCNR